MLVSQARQNWCVQSKDMATRSLAVWLRPRSLPAAKLERVQRAAKNRTLPRLPKDESRRRSYRPLSIQHGAPGRRRPNRLQVKATRHHEELTAHGPPPPPTVGTQFTNNWPLISKSLKLPILSHSFAVGHRPSRAHKSGAQKRCAKAVRKSPFLLLGRG